MDLTGEYTIAASRQEVWEALNDPEVLKLCIPGCEEIERLSDTQFTAKVTMKVGAVKARMKGNVELSDINEPNSYTITGQGQGGVAGFAKGGARVFLTDADGGGTLLKYEATAELGGKLAAVGSRVIQGISKKMADDFFGKFSRHLCGEEETLAEMSPAEASRLPVSAEPVSQPKQHAGRGPELPGTIRDLIWLGVGIAVGVAVTWAYSS